MTMESDVIAALDGYAGLSALVSARNHNNVLPQNPVYPNTVSSFERLIENTLGGETTGLKHAIVQIDVRAESYTVMRTVAEATKEAMAQTTNPFKSICTSDEDILYEDEIKVYRAALRFSVWQ